MVFNKKAISPVVATALLLVVAVVAVVGFQTWFNTYQSGLNVKVEQQSASGSALTIERLEASGNATIYIKNADIANDITVSSWKVTSSGTEVCAGATSITATKNTVTSSTGAAACSPALATGTAYDVVVVSTSGVYSASLIAR